MLQKESSQFDETIENRVVWRLAIFMLIELKEDQNGRMGISTMPWRPTVEAALPNRIVAQGLRMDIVQVD